MRNVFEKKITITYRRKLRGGAREEITRVIPVFKERAFLRSLRTRGDKVISVTE